MSGPTFYQIRIEEHLDQRWTDWFGGLAITPANSYRPETILAGHVADQAALYGVLAKIRDLNLTLIAVERKEKEEL